MTAPLRAKIALEPRQAEPFFIGPAFDRGRYHIDHYRQAPPRSLVIKGLASTSVIAETIELAPS